jgi:hypothetical protein
LIGYLGYAQFVSCRLALEHARPRVLRTSAISFAVMRALSSGIHCGASVRTAVDPRVEPAGDNERKRERERHGGERAWAYPPSRRRWPVRRRNTSSRFAGRCR